MLTQQQRDDFFLSLSGTSPEWSAYTFLTEPNDRPTAAGDGFDLTRSGASNPSIITGVQVVLEASLKRWVVTVDSVAAGDYTITVNSTDYTVTAAGSETVAQLVALLAAEVDDNTTDVTAIATTVDGDLPAVLVTSTTVTPPTVAVTGDLTLHMEATSADFRLWGYTGAEWTPLNAGSFESVDTGWIETVRTGIFTRLAVEVTATDGVIAFRVGPCASVAS